MDTVVIVIHLMAVVALIAVVLLQRSEGGALGMGGGSGFMTTRGSGNILTRSTAILATVFFLTSMSLTLMARDNGSKPTSILGSEAGGGTSKSGSNSVNDLINQLQPGGANAPAGGSGLPSVPSSQ